MNTYFHGGVPGLAPGQRIRPRAQLRSWRGVAVRLGSGGTIRAATGSFVYLTSDLVAARAYAADYVVWRGDAMVREPGDVYEVEPLGAADPDPDYALHWPEDFIRAREAVVVRVVERAVTMTADEVSRARLPYIRWEGDTPAYDEDGYLLPSPAMRQAGRTREELRSLGRWVRLNTVTTDGRPKTPGT